jgi:hypothetical protein
VLEHCFYTDNEYRTKAMAFANTAYVTNIPVYQYRVGREGQSVDITGLKKHYKDNLSVFRELAVFLSNLPLEANHSLTLKNVKSVVVYHYNTLILLNLKDEIRSFDNEVKKTNEELYRLNNKTIMSLRKNSFNRIGFYSIYYRLRNSIAGRIKMLFSKE